MRYRRAVLAGGSFFFTLVTEKRRPIFATAETVDVLRQAFATVKASRPFDMEAVVVMPDHLHCIWTLPTGDTDFASRWRLVKTWFTKSTVTLPCAPPQTLPGGPGGSRPSGSIAIGSMLYATREILPGMWSTSISIR